MLSLKNLVGKFAHNQTTVTRELLNSEGYKNQKVAEFKSLVKIEIERQKNLCKSRRDAKYLDHQTTIKQRLRDVQAKERRELENQKYLQRRKLELEKILKTSVVYAQKNQGITVVNGIIFRVNYDEDKNWNYYAKSYGFPKVTISNRRVETVTTETSSSYISFKSVATIASLENFAGNYLINAIANYLKLQPIKVSKHLKPIQLNNYFNPVIVHSFPGYKIYKLMFGDQLVKHCIVDSDGNTFHGNLSELVTGLKAKLQSKVERFATIIDYNYCKSFGFCDEGIEFFKADNNITVDSMRFEELQAIVTQNKKINEKYIPELRRMGIKI